MFSIPPELTANVRDSVVLCLNPPEKAVVVRVDDFGRTGPGRALTVLQA